jgi:hypothetical protein
MKSSAPEPTLLAWAVLPPLLVERIRRHYDALYGKEFTAENAFAQFLSEFISNAEFRDRIQATARELRPIVFDSQDPSWGIWPIDPEECAGIGFLLGLSLEESLDDCLTELPERRLAFFEEQVVRSGKSLQEIFIEMLIESKANASDPADWWKGGGTSR